MRSLLLAAVLFAAAVDCQAAQELVTVPTRRSVTETAHPQCGGDPPQSGPCDPQSPHGFLGEDAPVAQAMKSWMLGRDFPREIR